MHRHGVSINPLICLSARGKTGFIGVLIRFIFHGLSLTGWPKPRPDDIRQGSVYTTGWTNHQIITGQTHRDKQGSSATNLTCQSLEENDAHGGRNSGLKGPASVPTSQSSCCEVRVNQGYPLPPCL